MLVTSIISTKGGVGKTTVAANLGGFIADAGLRVLLIDLDMQPTLSSYYRLKSAADCGIYELIALNERNVGKLVSHTSIERLHLIFSNDDKGQLNTLLLHAPDGRFRLKNLLPVFASHYDLILIDTQGARSVTLEMAIVASDKLISPVTPEVLAAREFRRGTLQLLADIAPYRHLGITLAPIEMLMNRVPPVSRNAQLIHAMLRELFHAQEGIQLLRTFIPATEAWGKAATLATPVHRVERSRPAGRKTPAAIETLRALACELFPQWMSEFEAVSGKVARKVAL
jgi:chromosome partitioning related protein ParA